MSFQIKDGVLIGYKQDDEEDIIVIPDGVKEIGKLAFLDCSCDIIIIPNSVVKIGASAFSWCTGLRDITIPDSVKEIGDGAFYGCFHLRIVNISDSVQKIGEDAFHTKYDDLILRCPKGSKAEQYAKEYEIRYSNTTEQKLLRLKEYSNAELIKELSNRKGVETIAVEPNTTADPVVEGAATVLIVKD